MNDVIIILLNSIGPVL